MLPHVYFQSLYLFDNCILFRDLPEPIGKIDSYKLGLLETVSRVTLLQHMVVYYREQPDREKKYNLDDRFRIDSLRTFPIIESQLMAVNLQARYSYSNYSVIYYT